MQQRDEHMPERSMLLGRRRGSLQLQWNGQLRFGPHLPERQLRSSADARAAQQRCKLQHELYLPERLLLRRGR